MEDITVLITGGGAPGYPAFYKALRSSKKYRARIIAAELNPYAGNLFRSDWVDVAYRIPANHSPGFLPALFTVIQKEAVDFLISGIDEEMSLISENRGRFQELGCNLVLPPSGALECAFDKARTYQLLKQAVMMVPTVIYEPGLDLETAFEGFGGKAVVKASKGRGNRHNHTAENFEEFSFYARRLERLGVPFLLQKYIEGDECNVSMMLDPEGRCLYSVCRQKMDPPEKRPNTQAGLIRRDREMEETAVEAVRTLGLIPGTSNVEFLKDENDASYLLEVNGGRHAAQDYNLIHTGINIPEMLIDMAKGNRLPLIDESVIKEGTFCLKYLDELIVDFDQLDKRIHDVV